ncbi:MAG: prepilin peptidase [Clostridia bacterium]|nr:prepilin peptidase [Deltaproteobacteria bacterium]
MTLEVVGIAYFALLGTTVGSFLNVVVGRLPEGESIVSPRSRCPRCKTPIAWYDNIPIISWLVLGAKCRACKLQISARYPMVELLMGCIGAASFVRFGLTWELLVWFPIAAALLAITFLDIDHWWVPDVISFPCMAWALAGSFLPGAIGWKLALAGLIPALFLWALAWVFEKITKREGLGLGDVKLLAVIGLVLGPVGAVTALFFAAVQGAVIGIVVTMTGGHKAAVEPVSEDAWVPHPRAIPFGPFLALATYELVLAPDQFENIPVRIAQAILGMVGN